MCSSGVVNGCIIWSSMMQVAPPDHPAGTTWVWDDGSGVVLKAEEKAQEEIEQRKAEQKEEVRVGVSRELQQERTCFSLASRRGV